MTVCKHLRAWAVALACLGMLFPAPMLFGDETGQGDYSLVSVDIALEDGNSLQGVVVDGAGQPSEGVQVALSQYQKQVAAVSTSVDGRFQFELNSGGVYVLSAGDQRVLLRCWATATAPPHARTRLVVQSSDVVRGQIHPAACGLANPWVITGVAVAAIVIPVALHNNRADRDAGSD